MADGTLKGKRQLNTKYYPFNSLSLLRKELDYVAHTNKTFTRVIDWRSF